MGPKLPCSIQNAAKLYMAFNQLSSTIDDFILLYFDSVAAGEVSGAFSEFASGNVSTWVKIISLPS